MKNLKAKLRKKGGFTLIEMLIVVAIIAILIAVSIPMVGNALESARESTDASNERAFKAALMIEHLNSNSKVDVTKPCIYDATNGQVVGTGTTVTPYGQGTATAGTHKTGGDHKNMLLSGYVDADGVVKMQWGAAAITDVANITNGNLTGPFLTKGETPSANPGP